MAHPLLHELGQLLPAAALISESAQFAPRLIDERKRLQGQALALALPGSAQEAAQIVAACQRHQVAIVPQAGNTSLVGGATPLSNTNLLMGCDRLQAIRHIDPLGGSLCVEAGCTLDQVRAAAEAAGRLFPLWLGSSSAASVGGLLSTNAGGLQVLRYGNMRELTLGIEAVLADGRIYQGLHSLRKRNAGYDFKQLLIGGEGTLGFITAATLRIFPSERGRATAMLALPSAQAALELFSHLRTHLGEVLSAFELISEPAMQLLAQYRPDLAQPFSPPAPYTLLLEVAGGESDDVLQTRLSEALLACQIESAVLAQDLAQANQLWALRETIPAVQRMHGPSIKHDLALPISAIPHFIERSANELAKALPQAQPIVFGHMGDGNLHYNLSLPASADFAAAEACANALLFALAREMGGDISAEHGIGRLRLAAADHWHDPLERSLLRTIKQALDPQGLFNPGVLV